MKPSYFFTLLFLTVMHHQIQAQNLGSGVQKEVDSLKKELHLTRFDTARIRLRYYLGHKSSISRIGYWDSLASDAERCNARLFEGRTLNSLGYLCRMQNKNQKAIQSLNKCYAIASEIGNKPGMISPLLNLSSYYLLKNDIKKSLSYCYQALKIAEEINDKKKIASIYSEIAQCHFSLNEYDKALVMHLNSLKINQGVKDEERIALNLLAIGNDYGGLKNIKKMVDYYLACKKYTDTFGETVTAVEVNNSIGSGYLCLHELDSAYKYSHKAYKIARNTNSSLAIVGTMYCLSRIYFEKGDTKNARKLATEALAIAKNINFTLQIPSLTITLKNIYLKEKNYKSALEAYEIYVATKDSLSDETIRKQTLEKEFNYNLEKKESANKLLAQQNALQSIELKQNNYLMLGMVIVVLFVFFIGYLFVRQNRLKAEQQSSQLEQKLLRSQMNPHFIFNSLQAIQNFILKHDEKEAIRYLSSFASVTRNVLENSRMELIPLKKEIALLENYLQLQKLRFKNRFEYKIDIEETIDTETIVIPPMLAQPFIENAVEHGFHGIEGEGVITITYSIKNNALVMEIVDNGIGMKNGYTESKQHRSLALEITRERVNLMNKKAKEKVLFTIVEAFPLENKRKGVRVNFRLPLNLQ